MTSPTTASDGPPLDPSSPEARQWVLDELAKGHYTTQPSPLQRFLEWLWRELGGGPGGGLLPSWAVAVLVVVVLAAVALVVALRVRGEPSARGGGSRRSVVDEGGLAATDYRARATAARARGDWDAVLLDSYRALAAAAVERTLLTDLPGRTAHEVAVALEPAFPDHAGALAVSAAEFDAVRYGHRRTTQDKASAVADLDATLQSTRPVLGELATS
ncbi:protein of unknown function [Pedococcus dokdonensis]|uniref:Protein-glutamine gamma-glutamyltransferase-like C-terminal domain-containing protein n=1 Tax=Pedococcus dokdonensis TaxID=443156 RepID=A0A1H0RMY7_9MICO|nr:DUF4129 domain-containing protein [Pedococcus dokdonensis]SDP30348.1 protein of unknown function [Pedococcus dokdonensis]